MSFEFLKQAYASDNVSELIDEDKLIEIASQVQSGYDEDVNSRKEWAVRQDEDMKLALQVQESKSTPWPNASNFKYPLLTTATMQFGARSYPSLVTSPSIVKGRVTGFDLTGDKAKSADRVGKHMSYQLIEEMDNWEEDMDRLCLSIPIVGCMFKKTYFSPSKSKNVSELVYPKHLVVNYWTKYLKDAPRITHEIHLSENDIYERIESGLFTDQDYTKDQIEEDTTQNEVHGLQTPSDDTTPYLFLEQHTWLDLDDDGYKEPYIVTICNGKVARIVAGFDLDSVTVRDDQVIRIERIEYFTKYGFVPSPDGSFYDVGFGLLLGGINDSINTTVNQLHDAGTMSNRAGGFLGRGAKLKGGKHTFKPFEWQQIQSTGEDLRKNIVPLPVREPSNVLFSLLGLMIEAGKELSSTVPMMVGQNPGQNQPATTSMAVVEQGSKVYSSIFKRLHRACHQELKKLKRLNRLYLPPESYFQVLDKEEEGMDKIFQKDYGEDVTDVQLYSDPNIISETHRLIKAQQVSEMMQQNLIPNPEAAAKIILEAMDLPNIEELLTPPPPQPSPEFELEKLKVESEANYKMGKLEGEVQVMEAQVIVMQTQAMLNLAKAEAENDGIQIKIYEAQVKEFKERREGLQGIVTAARDDNKLELEKKKNEQPAISGMA